MKKFITTIAATLLLGTFAFAEAYISANDLDIKQLREPLECEDGFTIMATPEKDVEISTQSQDCPTEANGETFTKRIKLGGAGSPAYRSVAFKAKTGQKVEVYSKSSSKTDDRVVVLIDSEGQKIQNGVAPAYPGQIGKAEFTIPADGDYYISSKSSTIYIYEIIVQ